MQQILYFIRHGEPLETGRLLGSTDMPASERGNEQVYAQLQACGAITQVISSPLLRCQTVAHAFCETAGLPIQVDPRLNEMDFGDWDGQSYEALWQSTQSPGIGDFWQSPWQYTPPNGEPMSVFHQRLVDWWQQFTARPSSESVAIVTHAGVIKQLLAIWLGLPEGFDTHLSRLEIGYAKMIKVSVFCDETGHVWPKVVF
ncbi:histidine phosphatase family protein [Pseudoalteromonas rubra]|uniref:Histidine phosphatase family protein n=1 Tax=Pseudoalteromonas rubra TaxID=43658 RepID=A0A5S3WNG7_9GAMM|nr:histidine phosphatase family protein [Pseudoalteromonas rubra]TMP29565.1 histidine phosphatase family protein [Pseudoalteromonas rubra]TMP35158.1 histidine phosphatase family protein [Pseudoalteromonas rubra]